MRKSLILTLALLILTVAGMIFVSAGVSRTGDDVVWEETVLVGDVSAAEGLEVFTDIRCTNHMYWGTTYQVGHPENISTKFEFYPESRKYTREMSYFGINVDSSAGFGVSTSDGSIELDTDNLFGHSALCADVASRAQPGEEYKETVMLDDYYEYFPLEIDVDLPGVYISGNRDDNDPETFTEEERMAQALREFVKIPVPENTPVEVGIEKNSDGGVVGVHLNYLEHHLRTYAVSAYTEDKCYFVIDCVNAIDDTPVDMSHMAEGYGIYCLEYDSEKGTADTENIRNVFPMDRVNIEYFSLTEDQSRLMMITRENGAFYLSVISVETFGLLQKTEILPDGENTYFYMVYEGDGFFVVAIHNGDELEAVLLTPGEGGCYEKKFSHVVDELVGEDDYFRLYYARMAWDGERLAIAGHTDSRDDLCRVYVFVYTADGLEYLAKYDSSLEKGYVDKSSYRCMPESYSLGPIPMWK